MAALRPSPFDKLAQEAQDEVESSWQKEAGDDLQYRWQSTRCGGVPGAASPVRSVVLGASIAQRGMACGQRGWNRQPGGGCSGLGMSPGSTMRARLRAGSGCGIAEMSACV